MKSPTQDQYDSTVDQLLDQSSSIPYTGMDIVALIAVAISIIMIGTLLWMSVRPSRH